MSLDKNTVKTALVGVLLIQNPVLWETSGQPTEEHDLAIKSVQNDLDAFRKIVINELRNYPNTYSFFGNIIQARIFQDYPLESPFIQKLFSSGLAELENRLNRINVVKYIRDISKNVGATKSFNTGDETDEIIKDVWTELFVADFLLIRLKVKYIEKVKAEKSQPNIEFYVQNRKKNGLWKSQD
jgi:hypothetical protein